MAANAPTARSVGIDALLYIPGRAVPAVVQVLTVTLLTAFFLPEEIGRYDLALRFAVLLCTATVLWLNMAVLRLYPAHVGKESLGPFLSVLAWLRYSFLIAGSLVGALCWRFAPESLVGAYRPLILPAVLVFIGYATYESGLAFLRAKRKPLRYSIAATVNALGRLPLAAALIYWWHFDVSAMLWALAVTYVVSHAIFLQGQSGKLLFEFGAREKAIARTVLLYGLPVAGAQLLNFFLGNLDRYFLQGLRGGHDVGLYAVATNLVEQPMMLIFQTYTLAVFPSVAAAWEQHGRTVTEDLLRGITRIFLAACIPIGVFLSVFAEPIFRVLAKGGSVEAYHAAPWIAAAAFLYGLHYIANFGLHLAHKTGQLLGATIAALAANAALNYFLVPSYGVIGAGMARTAANAFFIVLLVLLSRRHLAWHFPWASCLKILAASLFAAGFTHWIIGMLNRSDAVIPLALTCINYGVTLLAGLVILKELPTSLRPRS